MERQKARFDSVRRPQRQRLMSPTVCFTLKGGGRAGRGQCVGVREREGTDGEKVRTGARETTRC